MSFSNGLRSGLVVWASILILWLSSGNAQAQLLRRALAQADVKSPAEPTIPAAPAAPTTPLTPTTPATEPATLPDAPDAAANEGAQVLKIVLVASQGNVQIRLAEGQEWQAAKVGMDLHIGAEIRTGLRSICQFTIDGNHTVTLDRLGVIKVLDAIKKDGHVKTDVGMKYGRTQYKVEADAAEHDARVHAPAATLAVRGSFVTLEDNAAFGSTAIVDESKKAIYKQRGPDGSVRLVEVELIKGRIEQGMEDAGKNPPSPGQVALRDTINDVGARLARASEAERDLVATYPIFNGADNSGGASLTDLQRQITETIFPTSPEGSFQEGGLRLEATWSGPDLIALFVEEPSFAGGKLSTVPGFPPGTVATIRPGGPATGTTFPSSNFASIHYANGVPGGTWNFGVALVNESTSIQTPFTINVFRDGVGGSPSVLVRTLSDTLGLNPDESTTIKITSSFQVSGVPGGLH